MILFLFHMPYFSFSCQLITFPYFLKNICACLEVSYAMFLDSHYTYDVLIISIMTEYN